MECTLNKVQNIHVEINGIIFDSCFDSGNLMKVVYAETDCVNFTSLNCLLHLMELTCNQVMHFGFISQYPELKIIQRLNSDS